jgi:hypothetical protein
MKPGYSEIYQAIFADWRAAGLPVVGPVLPKTHSSE